MSITVASLVRGTSQYFGRTDRICGSITVVAIWQHIHAQLVCSSAGDATSTSS